MNDKHFLPAIVEMRALQSDGARRQHLRRIIYENGLSTAAEMTSRRNVLSPNCHFSFSLSLAGVRIKHNLVGRCDVSFEHTMH